MRKLFAVAVTLCAIAWSGTAWAIVVDTQPKTPAGPETPGTSVHITLKDDKGKTVADKTAKVDTGGHAKVDISDEEKKKAKTVVITSTDKGKTYHKEVGIDVFMQGGELALTTVKVGLTQTGIAVHNPAPAHPSTALEPTPFATSMRMVDRVFFQWGFGMGEGWTKTSANDFGTGLGGSTIFDHTFNSTFLTINAGYFMPVFPGVAAGPVLQFVSGDMGGGNGLSRTTPSGIVGTSLVHRDWAFDAMGRVYFNAFGVNFFAQGGAEFAQYNGSMVNSFTEVFQNNKQTTSGIVGGGVQFPFCPFLVPSMNEGVCTLQGIFEVDHVFVDQTFFTGMTGPSSSTTSIKGETRAMAGFELTSMDVENAAAKSGFFKPDWGGVGLRRD